MKEIKTYDDLKEFAENLLIKCDNIPPNLVLEIKLSREDYCQLMTGISYIQYNQYGIIASSDSFTLKYTQLTFKITVKE
ncbi:hypothetical protein [uncultured Clostridium sp.]|uniref:hypothetical protein n=1 Tax=uncultured Clostridium sp. TaxID=59620 RepID=UPI002612C46B|nr:hypothetical protein [uncultured Clostridium sp.]